MAISSLTRENVSILQARIEEIILSHPTLNTPVPSSYPIFSEILRDYASNLDVPIISREQLSRLGTLFFDSANFFSALSVGFEDAKSLNSASRWLHEMGDILYFYKYPNLKDLVILKPNWLIDVWFCFICLNFFLIFRNSDDETELPQIMSTLFTTKHTWVKSGIMKHTNISQIWKGFSSEIHQKLLFILTKFGVIHTVPAESVPQVEYVFYF